MSSFAKPLVIGHRGASFDAPENTLAAFRLAWSQDADGIETDVRLSSDGRIVCIHDEDTGRVTGDKQAGLIVSESSYADLKLLDVGAWKGQQWRGEKIPTLDDVLAIAPDDKFVFIELKTGPEIVGPLADVLRHSPLSPDRILIISFNCDVLIACQQQLPQFRRHLLCEYQQQEGGDWAPTASEVVADLRRTWADAFGSQNQPEHFNQEFVKTLQAAGCDRFHVWTVDDPIEARMYQRLGVWAITTNKPGFLRTVLTTTSTA